jgi:hypothetical protein
LGEGGRWWAEAKDNVANSKLTGPFTAWWVEAKDNVADSKLTELFTAWWVEAKDNVADSKLRGFFTVKFDILTVGTDGHCFGEFLS